VRHEASRQEKTIDINAAGEQHGNRLSSRGQPGPKSFHSRDFNSTSMIEAALASVFGIK
jgi:hypothetical protein